MSSDTPEPGTRAKVKTDDGEETAIYTGHVWASKDGSRILEKVKTWKEAPAQGELEITNRPDELPDPPTGEEE